MFIEITTLIHLILIGQLMLLRTVSHQIMRLCKMN
jgi:hypothetical protein